MIWVIVGLGIVTTIIGYVIYSSCYWEQFGTVVSVIGGLVACIALIFAIFIGVDVTDLAVIDDMITMYEEENSNIENQIAVVVEKYMDHEYEVFSDANSSPITLTQLYPELKSDELIKSQIDIYVHNNEIIKKLKLKQIEGSVYRWWLYFGK